MLNFIELTDTAEEVFVLGPEVERQETPLYHRNGIVPEIVQAVEFFLPHSRPVHNTSGS